MSIAIRYLPALLLFLAICATGCTTSLTNMSPARTMEAGDGQALLGYQFDLHTQSVTGIARLGQAGVNAVENTDRDEEITEETLRTLLDAALLWRLFPIGGTPEALGRVGIYDGLLGGADVGFRFNGNVYKGDLRLQLWSNDADDTVISAQFGYGHHRSIVATAIEWIALTNFKRKDFDFQINFGYEIDEWAKFYVSPRYIASRISTEAQVNDFLYNRLPQEYKDWNPSQYFPDSTLHYIGLNSGAMLGYRYAFINIDLSIFRVLYKPEVLGSERDYNGWVVSPTMGFSVLWH